MGARDRIGTKMTEKQFLELSGKEFNDFIAKNIFGYKGHENWWWWEDGALKDGEWDYSKVKLYAGPCFDNPEGLFLGIEHANKDGYYLAFSQWYDGSWDVGLVREGEDRLVEGCRKTIFLAFWIAYCKTLGVIK